MKRREALKLLSATGLWAILPACSKTISPPLRLALQPWLGYEFIWHGVSTLAELQQRVSLHNVHSGSESIQALLSGQVDAALLTLDEVLRARAKQIPLTIVLALDISKGADVVLVKPPKPSQLSELKGARIGVEQGALGTLMLDRFLAYSQLEAYQLPRVNLTPNQQEEAWEQEDIDLLICYSPVSDRLERNGAIRLFDSSQMPELIVDVLAVHQDQLATHADTLQKLINEHFKQRDAFVATQQLATPILKHLDLSQAEGLQAFKRIQLPDRKHNQALLGGSTPQLLHSATTVQSIMLEAQLLPQASPLTKLLSDQFL